MLLYRIEIYDEFSKKWSGCTEVYPGPGLLMTINGMKAPDTEDNSVWNEKTVFFFTELGWNLHGKLLWKMLEGYQTLGLRVCCNESSFQFRLREVKANINHIFYQDNYQIACEEVHIENLEIRTGIYIKNRETVRGGKASLTTPPPVNQYA